MVRLISTIALAAILLAGADAAEETAQGCYKKVSPPLEELGEWKYQSHGWCSQKCTEKKKAVFALYSATHCFCGNELPPDSQKTDNSSCTAVCPGYGTEYCKFHSSSLHVRPVFSLQEANAFIPYQAVVSKHTASS